ncbi:hypothetical protein BDW42DRAFT_172770 [Aspergillus taichungensis]|uniref:Uncharacterized protein n=1 Tax=Aspergillus taichungensis TaxID=482145 RepID=A0A2J5HQV8_9EURO|nr:hypothetical protein BDW42DRAFT_172770 [Aspergillus taichungensis]
MIMMMMTMMGGLFVFIWLGWFKVYIVLFALYVVAGLYIWCENGAMCGCLSEHNY